MCPSGTTECGGSCVQNCTGGRELDANCQCVCPGTTVECGGECVSNECSEGQEFNPETCMCEATCPDNGVPCGAGCCPAGSICVPFPMGNGCGEGNSYVACVEQQCPSGGTPCTPGTIDCCPNAPGEAIVRPPLMVVRSVAPGLPALVDALLPTESGPYRPRLFGCNPIEFPRMLILKLGALIRRQPTTSTATIIIGRDRWKLLCS